MILLLLILILQIYGLFCFKSKFQGAKRQ